MSDGNERVVVFVHGWSVSNTDTYGEFPARLQREARNDVGLELDIHNVWLGKYVSFRDPVRVEDLARGFQAAVKRQLTSALRGGKRFICITHSTGGPVIREWWDRYYHPGKSGRDCPMSHLIMLAPANFGSALAQLGKSRISRLKSYVGRVEPGTGVLDWLELGSPESVALNRKWMDYPDFTAARGGIYPFVLTGQMIDRSVYDHVNSYTGEDGSDGVVRVAAANLNSTYVRLEQDAPSKKRLKRIAELAVQSPDVAKSQLRALTLPLRMVERKTPPATAFGLVAGRSHSGDKMGILRSVKDERRSHPSVSAVLDCVKVGSKRAYSKVTRELAEQNERVMRRERVEVDEGIFSDSYYFHDRFSMIVFRLFDDRGFPLTDFDLKLTGGPDGDPDHLPKGFFKDRQRNRRHPGTVTYYLNYDVMMGAPAITRRKGSKRKVIRAALPGATHLGVQVIPRPRFGYAHYHIAELKSSARTLSQVIKPNQTTIVDIEFRRVVHEGVFELTKDQQPKDFRGQPAGGMIG